MSNTYIVEYGDEKKVEQGKGRHYRTDSKYDAERWAYCMSFNYAYVLIRSGAEILTEYKREDI